MYSVLNTCKAYQPIFNLRKTLYHAVYCTKVYNLVEEYKILMVKLFYIFRLGILSCYLF